MDDKDLPLGPVIIFGGCGFLDHHTARQLSLAPDATSVRIFNITTSKNRIPGATYITRSITPTQDVSSAILTVQPKVLFHTISPGPFLHDNHLFHASTSPELVTTSPPYKTIST